MLVFEKDLFCILLLDGIFFVEVFLFFFDIFENNSLCSIVSNESILYLFLLIAFFRFCLLKEDVAFANFDKNINLFGNYSICFDYF